MKRIHLNTDQEKHICTATNEGDCIIYRCTHPDCDYKRSFNPKTGKMKFEGTQTNILHKGQSFPVGIDPVNLKMN